MNRADLFGIGIIIVLLLISYHISNKNSSNVQVQGARNLTQPPVPKSIIHGGVKFRFTKYVKIMKDTSGRALPQNTRSDWRAIHVAYIDVENDHRVKCKINSAKLSSIMDSNHTEINILDGDMNTFGATAANDSIATLTLTLEDETFVETINFMSSVDYRDSLVGSKIILEDITGAPIWVSDYLQPGRQTIHIDSKGLVK